MRNRVRMLAAVSYLVYACLPAYLILSKDLCSTCSASELWKVWIWATLVPSVLFVYLCGGWGKTQSARLIIGVFSILIVLCNFVIIGILYIPEFTFASFSITYDIQYFHWLAFPFPSGLVLVLAAASAINSFNLTVGFRRGTRVEDGSSLTKTLWTFWSPVLWGFSVLTGPVLLVEQQFGGGNQFLAFSVLFCAVLTIPLFSAFYEKFERLPRLLRVIVVFLGLGSFMQASSIRDITLQGLSPSHPFQLVALFSAVASCMSSGIGVTSAQYVDLRRVRRRLGWRFYLVVAVLVLLAIVTWYFSSAHYSVWIQDQITLD